MRRKKSLLDEDFRTVILNLPNQIDLTRLLELLLVWFLEWFCLIGICQIHM